MRSSVREHGPRGQGRKMSEGRDGRREAEKRGGPRAALAVVCLTRKTHARTYAEAVIPAVDELHVLVDVLVLPAVVAKRRLGVEVPVRVRDVGQHHLRPPLRGGSIHMDAMEKKWGEGGDSLGRGSPFGDPDRSLHLFSLTVRPSISVVTTSAVQGGWVVELEPQARRGGRFEDNEETSFPNKNVPREMSLLAESEVVRGTYMMNSPGVKGSFSSMAVSCLPPTRPCPRAAAPRGLRIMAPMF